MQGRLATRGSFRFNRWSVHVLTAVVLLCGVVVAENVDVLEEPSLLTNSPADPPVAAVAAELLKLQEQLGGSIVNEAPTLVEAYSQPQEGDSPTRSLREAAWRLDLTARQLELADLLEQADTIRNLSNRLREDARALEAGNLQVLRAE